MIQYWHQANAYAKFILILGLVYPICMAILAYKIEKLFPDRNRKGPIGGNQVRAHEKHITVSIPNLRRF